VLTPTADLLGDRELRRDLLWSWAFFQNQRTDPVADGSRKKQARESAKRRYRFRGDHRSVQPTDREKIATRESPT
jgi:hypothetical protein